jgi:hypothetical protein
MLTSSSRQPLRRLILIPALIAALLGGSAFASEHGGGNGRGGSGGGDGCKQCFAIVGSGGTLLRGNGAVSVMHAQAGVYDVTFRKPVAGCAATASATAGPTDPVVPAYAMVIPSAASLNAFRVVTFAGGSNAPTEQAFQVVVDCG